jgi:hypothetical protein
MDVSNNSISTGKHGAPFTTVTQHQSWIIIHPDHVGFVIGAKGATVKKIASDCRCYVKIQDPNQFSCGFPWFVIKGSTEANVCEAYHRIRTIANEAERRLPRLSAIPGPAPRARAKLVIKESTPKPSSPVDMPEVTVTKMTDNDGIDRLVDSSTNEVYDDDGRLVGHWDDGVVLGRSDASV